MLKKKNHFGFIQQYELPAHLKPPSNLKPLLTQSLKTLDLEKVIYKEVSQKILEDEQNDKRFYDIFQIDQTRIKKRNQTNFKSTHVLSDLALIRGCKFYQDKNLNVIEQKVRKQLKKQPENQLLMSEIYKKLEENPYSDDGGQTDTKAKTMHKTHNNSISSINNESINQNDNGEEKKDLNESIVVEGLEQWRKQKQKEKQIPDKKELQQQQKEKPKLAKIAGQITSFIRSQSRKQSTNSSNSPRFDRAQTKRQSGFLDAIKTMGKNKDNINSSQNFIEYMKSVQSLNTLQQNINNKDDVSFTPEEVKKQLEALYKGQTGTFVTVVEQCKFYEKQNNLLEQKIMQKIKDNEAYIQNKSNTERLLRLENHQILDKMREIKNLIKKLSDELQSMQTQVIDKSRSPEKRNTVLPTISPNTRDQNNNIIRSTIQAPSITDQLLNMAQREHDLEKEIQILKESHKKFEQKIRYNNSILLQLEEEIATNWKQHKILQKSKKAFFFFILKQGNDCREESLTWIIRAIWNFGEKVVDNQLPDFLDQKAKEFLIAKSVKQQEVTEVKTILDLQMDIYKRGLNTADLESLELMQNKSMDESLPDELIPQMNQDQSIISQQYKVNQENSGISLPTLIHDKSQSNNLSLVDVSKIKIDDLQKRKKKRTKQMNVLMEGMNSELKQAVEKTMDELDVNKSTTNDIIYNETQKKIKQKVTDWIQNRSQQNKSKDANLDSANLGFDNSMNSIILYENTNQLNKYRNREEFIKEYQALQAKHEEKRKVIKIIEEAEIQRIIKEFDYKQYGKRFNIDCGSVLSALFGASQADKLIIRYGMMKQQQ